MAGIVVFVRGDCAAISDLASVRKITGCYFKQTYRAEFNDPSLDVLLDYSHFVVTSCGTDE